MDLPRLPGSGGVVSAGVFLVKPELPGYAELHCLSNFSFLRGASHAEELVERAKELGYAALALTDECSFAGIVRAHVAAKAAELKLICGTEIVLADGMKLVLLAQTAPATAIFRPSSASAGARRKREAIA